MRLAILLANRAAEYKTRKEKIMAYDPEARRQSNTATIVAVIVVLIIAALAIAYFVTQNPTAPGNTPVVVTPGTSNTVVNNSAPPAPASPPSVVVKPAAPAAPAAPSAPSTTKSSSGGSDSSGSTSTNP
jgi:hypothetical protein